MIAVVVIFVVIGLVINGLTFYYGLWKGMQGRIKGIWASASSDTRRDLVKAWVFMALLAVVLATLLIVSPFGATTPIFVFGGVGVCLCLWLNGYVIFLVRQNRRPK
jgi:hypothetical protein